MNPRINWRAIVAALYVILLVHFLVSNFIATVGPSFVIDSSAPKTSINCSSSDPVACLTECGNLSINSSEDIPPQKGFPAATNHAADNCPLQQQSATPGNNKGWEVNVAYITVLTLAAGLMLIWPVPKKPKPLAKRR